MHNINVPAVYRQTFAVFNVCDIRLFRLCTSSYDYSIYASRGFTHSSYIVVLLSIKFIVNQVIHTVLVTKKLEKVCTIKLVHLPHCMLTINYMHYTYTVNEVSLMSQFCENTWILLWCAIENMNSAQYQCPSSVYRCSKQTFGVFNIFVITVCSGSAPVAVTTAEHSIYFNS